MMAPRPLPLSLREIEDTLRALSVIGSFTLPEGMEPISSNEEIDRILAEEAMNPHDDEPEESGDTPGA